MSRSLKSSQRAKLRPTQRVDTIRPLLQPDGDSLLWEIGTAREGRGPFNWLRGLDLNQRPLGYEPNELPGCSTPHLHLIKLMKVGQRLTIAASAPDSGAACALPAEFAGRLNQMPA
jgi:hypothetical protein